MSVTDRPTALVLGATGGIGSALIRELHADGGPDRVKVRATFRRPEAGESLKKLGVETALLDLDGVERVPIAHHEPLRAALAGVDRLFLLTGYSVDMLVQSKAVIDAAKVLGVKHIVHLGAWAKDDTTIVHLGWHQFVERYIAGLGFDFTHLRPNVFMQNILKFSLGDDGIIRQFIGDAAVSWVDTDDVALAAASVLREPEKHRGKTYPLAVEALSVAGVAAVLTDVIGKPFRYEPTSPDVWRDGAIQGGLEPLYARCVHNVFTRTAEGTLTDAADVFDDFETLTGRKPTLWRDHAAKHRDAFLARFAKP
ncbi:NmrA family NAD(P)-binding protein [Pendulispora albinea]|uniref:NmrA family NAD(P)-binding protein n=1 Tax=Pendulispora albinea TaxID=2741071 RepID=A0ABZ2M273_9BACT